MLFATFVSFVLLAARADVRIGHPDAPTQLVRATTVLGVVYDSLAMRGLNGATVQMTDAGNTWTRTVESDSVGAFRIDDVPAGTYLLGFFHAKLDSMSLAPPMLRVDVRTEQPVHVRLAIPSARTMTRSLCGAKALADSTGLLLGYLRSAETSMPRAAGTLSVRWAEIVIERNSIRRVAPSATVTASPTGLFAVCGIPTETPLLLQAASASDSSGAFELIVPGKGFLHRDIFVAPLTREKVSVSDSAPAVDMLRGSGRLRGQVVGATGRPISGARVMVWGTGLETLSNPDGRFSLAGLPGGTHTLEVRAVGFSPAQRAVDIVQGAAGATEVELANLGITLDTVRVTAQRLFTSQRLADFERRLKMRTGTGHLIDESEIERRRPLVLTDLLRTIPGVQVLPGRASGDDVFMRGGAGLGSGMCRPDFYVDGVRVVNDEMFPINSLVSAHDVRAVEVYPHASLVPVELQTMSGCGVVVVWTGGRRVGNRE